MPTPQGQDAQGVTEDALRVAVDIDVSEISGRLEREALRLLKEGSIRGLTGQALSDYVTEGLKSLSDAPISRAARGAASEAYNLGRNLEIQRKPEAVASVVRSEILDFNTCPPCRALDGTVIEVNGPVISASIAAYDVMDSLGIDPKSKDAYHALMPPIGCNGHELCRGFDIARAA